MNDSPLATFGRAFALFQEQNRSEFGQRLAADVLEPMERELEALMGDLERTMEEAAALESQLSGD